MTILVKTGKKELLSVGIIWLFLMTVTAGIIIAVNRNTHKIINHLEYVETGRYGRSMILYSEAEKHGKIVVEKSDSKTTGSLAENVSANDPNMVQAVTLNSKAEEIDPRPKFAPDRFANYTLMAQLYDLTGNQFQSQLYYAKALASQGQWAKAIDYAKIGTEKESTSHQARTLLTDLYLRSNQTELAKTNLDILFADAANPTADDRLIRAHYLIQTGDRNEANAEYKKAFEQSRGNSDIGKAYAVSLADNGQPQQALAIYKAALGNGGLTDPNYLHLYAQLLVTEKQYAEAIDIISKAIEIEPNNGVLYMTLSQAYNDSGKQQLGLKAHIKAVQLDPSLQETK